jgi:hypothetical protein
MIKREQIRAARRALGFAEGLLAIFAAVADELAAIQDEIAASAMLEMAEGELASAKDSVEAALAALRRWVMDIEVNDDDEAGEEPRQ